MSARTAADPLCAPDREPAAYRRDRARHPHHQHELAHQDRFPGACRRRCHTDRQDAGRALTPPPVRKRLCVGCGRRCARFRYRNRWKRDRTHMLCRQCYEALRDSMRHWRPRLAGLARVPAPRDAKASNGRAVTPAPAQSTTHEPGPTRHAAHRSRRSAQQILQGAVDVRETKPEPHREGAVRDDALAGEEG